MPFKDCSTLIPSIRGGGVDQHPFSLSVSLFTYLFPYFPAYISYIYKIIHFHFHDQGYECWRELFANVLLNGNRGDGMWLVASHSFMVSVPTYGAAKLLKLAIFGILIAFGCEGLYNSSFNVRLR